MNYKTPFVLKNILSKLNQVAHQSPYPLSVWKSSLLWYYPINLPKHSTPYSFPLLYSPPHHSVLTPHRHYWHVLWLFLICQYVNNFFLSILPFIIWLFTHSSSRVAVCWYPSHPVPLNLVLVMKYFLTPLLHNTISIHFYY